jgi:hypothetical protein
MENKISNKATGLIFVSFAKMTTMQDNATATAAVTINIYILIS